jgi:conjugal transfer mating pair stabilization protein TraN
MRTLLILLCGAIIANLCAAAECVKSGSICVDATPCKNISGVDVCLSDIGQTCWEYQDTYTCIKPDAVNYCQPFIDAQPQCWQSASQCSQMDTLLNTGCMRYQQTWRCNDASKPTPSNTVRLADTYTLVSSNYDPGPCQSLENNTNCSLAESQCVSTTPGSPLPSGIDSSQVAADGCYQKQNTYVCLTGKTDTSECDGYSSNPNCTLQSKTCDADDVVNGTCTLEQQTYMCVSQPAKTNTVTDCSGQQFCQNGSCFDTGYENDTDFGRAMALMEAAREAGVYSDQNSIFGGVASKCTIKLFGMKSCCNKSSGGGNLSNSALFQTATQAGGQTLRYGSAYVYDALLDGGNAGSYVAKGLDALAAGAHSTQVLASGSATDFSPSLSMYGFSLSYGPLQEGILSSVFSSAFPSSWVATYNAATVTTEIGGGFFMSFNPYALAFAVVMMVVQEMLACDEEEIMLAMKRGQNLCVEIGSYCSKKVLKSCAERTKSYCCYNSRLARIINEQGRSQIGKGWGSPKSPNCSGFTPEEFASIDFSRIDLSEFVSEIMANISISNLSGIPQNAQSVVQEKMNNYYQ